jgi:TRAP transporter TAXI family solute receptor
MEVLMKKTLILTMAFLFGFSLLMGSVPSPVEAKTTFVTIGTGGVTGVYYPTGGAISKIVNQKKDKYKLRVTVESTGGSVFNVNAVMAGDLEFGIVQSDRQYQAWNGIKDWKDSGPQKDLRAICSFHPESVVLVAGDDTGINTFMDLKGKHVNIGNPGSGQLGNSTDAFDACGIDKDKDLRAEGLKADESAKMLQDGRIDAFFYTVGHPNGSIKEATSGSRKVHFVPIEGPCIDKLVAKWPFYANAYIPIKFYEQASNKENVNTFAVKATFCTSVKVPNDVVYAITKELFDNLEAFKKLHPAYEILTKENMLEALSAPIHPGAMRYYKEVGLK